MKKLTSEEVQNRDVAPSTSRYKNARYFNREIRRDTFFVEPESWKPPSIPVSANDHWTTIKPGEESRLDLVSLRVYGNVSLWWVIAYANNIIDPFSEATVNKKLRYPPFDVVANTILA